MQYPPLLDLLRAARVGGGALLAAGHAGHAAAGRAAGGGHGQGAAHVPHPRRGEAVTGDIPSFQKTDSNEETERQAIAELLSPLPDGLRGELTALFTEMDALATPEARVYKALDKLEVVVQHNEAPLDTWLPLEYELNQTYGIPEAAPFPPLAALREQARLDTLAKLAEKPGGC